MAASAQWRDTAGAVSEIAGSHLGTSVTIANLNAAVGAAVQAMSNNPAHEVCLLTSQGNMPATGAVNHCDRVANIPEQIAASSHNRPAHLQACCQLHTLIRTVA